MIFAFSRNTSRLRFRSRMETKFGPEINVLTRSTRADEAHHIIKKGLLCFNTLERSEHGKGGRVLLIYITACRSLFKFGSDYLQPAENPSFGSSKSTSRPLTITKSVMKAITRSSAAFWAEFGELATRIDEPVRF